MKTPRALPLATRRGIGRLPPHAMIRALRAELYMTQAQLAKRAGVTQPHLARIEAGKVDFQLSTLLRIFGALNCDALVVARALKTPKDAVRERVKETARRNVLRVTGTMALERQTPDDETISGLIRSEEKRLLARPSSEMWKD